MKAPGLRKELGEVIRQIRITDEIIGAHGLSPNVISPVVHGRLLDHYLALKNPEKPATLEFLRIDGLEDLHGITPRTVPLYWHQSIFSRLMPKTIFGYPAAPQHIRFGASLEAQGLPMALQLRMLTLLSEINHAPHLLFDADFLKKQDPLLLSAFNDHLDALFKEDAKKALEYVVNWQRKSSPARRLYDRLEESELRPQSVTIEASSASRNGRRLWAKLCELLLGA